MRLGIALPGGSLPDAVGICVEAERLGYGDVWSYEVGGYDAFTPLAALAARTSHVRLGTAVVPASTRPPALLAMTAAAMQSVSNGRFCLGMGTSTATIVNRWMGLPFSPSVAALRETISAIRAITAGEKVNGFRLEHGACPVPIYIGALGPRMVELAAEVADGVILSMVTPEHVQATVASIHRDDFDVVLSVPVALDAPDAIASVRESFAAYGVIDVYNRHLVRQGFEVEAGRLREAWARRSWQDSVAAITYEMVSAMSIIGDESECREQIAGFEAAGVKTLLLTPVTRPAETLRRLAP